jgi:predicted nucleic acid-binding protein
LRIEINSVLGRSELAPFDKRKRIIVGTLFNQALMVLPRRIAKPVFGDENDHFLYDLAVTGQADAIVTGDKLLLKIKKTSGIVILNPDQFCKRFKIK